MRRQYLQPSKKYRAERFFVRGGEPNETVTRERRRRRRNFFCLNHVVLTGRPRDDLRIDCLKLSEASSKARFRLVFFFTERRALSTRAPLCLKRPLLPWASLLTSVAQSNSASASAGAPARQPVWGLHSTERVGRSRRVLLIYGPNSFFFFGYFSSRTVSRSSGDSPHPSSVLLLFRLRRTQPAVVLDALPFERRRVDASLGTENRERVVVPVFFEDAFLR